VAEQVSKFRPHPFADDLASPPEGASGMAPFLDQCIEGVRRRGDLAEHLVAEIQPDVSVVVFPEPHHAGHFLWYTVEPDPQFYGDLLADGMPSQTLKDLYRELDRQVGRLVAAAGPDTAVLVFALHGMELARGVPSVLEPLLEQLGMACLDESTGRRRSILSRVKARVPERLRNVYRRSVPLSRRSQWGQSAILPSYDWSRTRAFVLPIEHEGQIRLNLAGREAEGIVPPEQYDEVCESIEKAVRALTTADGRPIVRDVIRPPRGAHLNGLPDLVVHWHRAAFESSIRLGEVDAPLIRRWQTGQHAPDGFCIANGPASAAVTAEPIPAEEMHRVIVAALGR
jgi:predicted AlkP superfamily phosphohydrolase/phosphomutase